jgi:anti-anti-sigma factor
MAVSAQDQMSLSIATSSDGSTGFVRILGDVDLSDSQELGIAAQRILTTPTTTLYVDLGGTTFIGSTLIAFLVRIGEGDGVRRVLVLCRPTPTARRVIQMTDLGKTARLQPDLPPQWPDTPALPEQPPDHLNERPTSP